MNELQIMDTSSDELKVTDLGQATQKTRTDKKRLQKRNRYSLHSEEHRSQMRAGEDEAVVVEKPGQKLVFFLFSVRSPSAALGNLGFHLFALSFSFQMEEQ